MSNNVKIGNGYIKIQQLAENMKSILGNVREIGHLAEIFAKPKIK